MRIRLIILILTVSALFISEGLYACSCGRYGILENQKDADIVFSGKVIATKEIITYDTVTHSKEVIKYRRFDFTFEVRSIDKGKQILEGTKTVSIITTGGGADCGSYFNENEDYLVYAYKADKKLGPKLEDQQTDAFWSTDLCTRTKKIGFFTFLEKFILRIT